MKELMWLLTNSKYNVDGPFHLGHFVGQIKKKKKLI